MSSKNNGLGRAPRKVTKHSCIDIGNCYIWQVISGRQNHRDFASIGDLAGIKISFGYLISGTSFCIYPNCFGGAGELQSALGNGDNMKVIWRRLFQRICFWQNKRYSKVFCHLRSLCRNIALLLEKSLS